MGILFASVPYFCVEFISTGAKLMNAEAVALEIQEPLKKLTYLEKIRNRLYVEYYISKRSGGKREICVYLCDSKEAQARLKNKLRTLKKNDAELEKLVRAAQELKTVHRKLKELLDRIPLPDCVFGFRKNESIVTCARKHVGKKYVISLDIKDFFPSVTSDMVLRQLKREGFEDTGAWLIARLVAFKGVLPQGAITSPAASNVAFKPYDEKLQKYFEERGFVYTRYADDVTVSTDQEVTDEMIQQIVEETSQIIAPFKWNAKKIKIYGPNEPHYVLGLIVNAKPNVPKQKRRLIRAMVHNFVRKHALPQGEDPIRYKRKLMGKLAYCLFVNPHIESLLELYEELRKFDPNRVSEWKSLYVSEEEGE